MTNKFLGVQFAAYLKDSITERPDKLSVNINEKTDGVFDALPIILPLPSDIPEEIPFIQLNSTDNTYNLNIGRLRMDFFYMSKEQDHLKDYSEQKNSFIDV